MILHSLNLKLGSDCTVKHLW